MGFTDNPQLAFCINGSTDYGGTYQTLDLMKKGRPFEADMTSGPDMSFYDLKRGGYLDADGYVTEMPVGADIIRMLWAPPGAGAAVPPEALEPQVFTWVGDGTLNWYGDVMVTSTSDHRIEFYSPTGQIMYLAISVINPADYPRGMRCVPARYEALANAGEIWHPDWMREVRNARLIRPMGPMFVNDSGQVNYTDRPLMTSSSWSGWTKTSIYYKNKVSDFTVGETITGGTTGSSAIVDEIVEIQDYLQEESAGILVLSDVTLPVLPYISSNEVITGSVSGAANTYTFNFNASMGGMPVEALVDLHNKLGCDFWPTLFHLATDDYVEQFATYVRDNLNPALKVVAEFSNETWNGQFLQKAWCSQMAIAWWGAGADAGSPERDFQAMRSAQHGQIWKDVFAGQLERLEFVVGIQQNGTGTLTNYLLTAPAWDAAGEPGVFIDPTTVTTAASPSQYFGHMDDTSNADLTAYLLTHTYEEAADYLKALILNPSFGSSIPNIVIQSENVKAACVTAGIKMLAYEGGQHMHNNNGGTVGPFLKWFATSQQLADLYAVWWSDIGPIFDGPIMQFVDEAPASNDFTWGLVAWPGQIVPRAELLYSNNLNEVDAWLTGGTQYLPQVIDQLPAGGGTIEFNVRGGLVVGGSGQDIAVLDGSPSDYTVTRDEDGYHYTGASGEVRLVGAFNCVRFSG